MDLVRIFVDNQNHGGILMWIIFAVGIIALYTGIDKAFFLVRFEQLRKKFRKNADLLLLGNSPVEKIGFDEFDTLLSQLKVDSGRNATVHKNLFREFLISTMPLLERHFSSMNALVSVAPLLGLLGTVIGMVQTFKVIMDFGVGNPALTAEGISVALLTTEAGLIVAFPVMLFCNYLSNKKTAIVNKLLKDFESVSSGLSKKGARNSNV
ncbi:MAG TPA: MotA/TolQ/ExbB proton channel family protein [Chitinispirillaceae bacterium]|nr:MotA/TolQ/ExbB proton channel family protein [Chitinispirillaceae bacterium]